MNNLAEQYKDDLIEYRFNPIIYLRAKDKSPVQTRVGIHWLWFMLAYKVMSLTTGEVLKYR